MNRSTANTRRISSSRSSRPRRSSGAAAAGPLPCWTFSWWPLPCWPWVTNVPQRRQRQAVPPAVGAISRSLSSGSSGAYVTCPLRAQPNRLQSTTAPLPHSPPTRSGAAALRYTGVSRRPPPCSAPMGEGDGQAEMTDHKIPSRGQTATFSVNGVKRGDGMLLLYPDELTVVNTRSIGTWVYVLVPAIYLAVHFYLFHRIGWGIVAIWYAAGWWVWQALGRRL